MSDYADSVAHNLEGLEFISPGCRPGCDECGLSDVPTYDDDPDRCQCADEGSFSWSECDCCGSTFGGDRYAAHGTDPETGTILHLDVCADCLMYLANGDEPESWERSPR